MNIIKRYLPSKCYYNASMPVVRGEVFHFISAKNVKPNDPFNIDEIIKILITYKFSAHRIVDRDGTVYELMPQLYKAKHAGKSRMNGIDWCNGFTKSIEFVGGTEWGYTEEQIITGAQLTAQDMTEHQFSLDWVQGHDQIRAAWNEAHPDDMGDIKVDPGEHFPWGQVKEMLAGVDLMVRMQQ